MYGQCNTRGYLPDHMMKAIIIKPGFYCLYYKFLPVIFTVMCTFGLTVWFDGCFCAFTAVTSGTTRKDASCKLSGYSSAANFSKISDQAQLRRLVEKMKVLMPFVQ